MKYIKQNQIGALLSLSIFIFGLVLTMPNSAQAGGYGYYGGNTYGGNHGGNYNYAPYGYNRASTPVYYTQPVYIPQPQPIYIPQPQPIYISQPQPIYIQQPQQIIIQQPQPIIIQQPQPVYYPVPSAALTASCFANSATAYTSNYVTWSTRVGGGSGNYTFAWSGTDYTGGDTYNELEIYYPYPGYKTMNVTVSSSDGQMATASCGTVSVLY